MIILDYVTEVKSSFRMEQWKKIILDCQSSGLKVDTWCEQNSVSRNSYYYWLRKIREQSCQSLSTEQVPAIAEAPFAKLEFHDIQQGSHSRVVIHFPSATVEIREGTSRQTVEAVLSALKKYVR